MGSSIKSSFDTSQWNAIFAKLDGTMRESLARRMLVSGGVELRDEAKRWVPVKDRTLQNAIYLAYRDVLSTESRFTYSVSWNAKLAPHGHLQEFGHWMIWQTIYNAKTGQFMTLATGKGARATGVRRKGGPKWIAAKPFLRPAMDIASGRARDAMLARGRAELPILLKGNP